MTYIQQLNPLMDIIEHYSCCVERGEVGLLVFTIVRKAMFGSKVMGQCRQNQKSSTPKGAVRNQFGNFRLYPSCWLEPENLEGIWKVRYTAIQQTCGRHCRDLRRTTVVSCQNCTCTYVTPKALWWSLHHKMLGRWLVGEMWWGML